MNAETFFNNGFSEDCEKVHRNHVIELMQNYAEHYYNEQLRLHDVGERSEQLTCPRCKSTNILNPDKDNDAQCIECAFVWAG